jgi:hypothetical protein
MKKQIAILITLSSLLTFCGQKDSVLTGSWKLKSIHVSDTSNNSSVAANSFFGQNSSIIGGLSFSPNGDVHIQNKDGNEIGFGRCIFSNENNMELRMLSATTKPINFSVVSKDKLTVDLTAVYAGETIYLLITK